MLSKTQLTYNKLMLSKVLQANKTEVESFLKKTDIYLPRK